MGPLLLRRFYRVMIFSKFLLLSCGMLTLGVLKGCGGDISTYNDVDTGCSSGAALIGVYNGLLKGLCGCGEKALTEGKAGQKLPCTVKSGSTVIFQFEDTSNRHQIISEGTPGFVSSPIYDPMASNIVNSHGVLLNQTGTYHYKDAFDSNLQGQIIVQ
jgi:hypothetical protein